MEVRSMQITLDARGKRKAELWDPEILSSSNPEIMAGYPLADPQVLR
jgi:hypothetical protein